MQSIRIPCQLLISGTRQFEFVALSRTFPPERSPDSAHPAPFLFSVGGAGEIMVQLLVSGVNERSSNVQCLRRLPSLIPS